MKMQPAELAVNYWTVQMDHLFAYLKAASNLEIYFVWVDKTHINLQRVWKLLKYCGDRLIIVDISGPLEQFNEPVITVWVLSYFTVK